MIRASKWVHILLGLYVSPVILFPIPILGFFVWYELLYQTQWNSTLPKGYINDPLKIVVTGLLWWIPIIIITVSYITQGI